MSQSSNNKGRDNGKKYASFNLNSTFNKGTKFDGKSSLGQNNRHGGLQSLGKVKQRVLQPTNLPSLKSENSGNDPRVNLVPSGNSGWFNKKDNVPTKQTSSPSLGGAGGVPKAQSKPAGGQDISLRPNAGVDPSKIQKTSTEKAQESLKQSWVAKVQPQPQGPVSSTYFQREFPKLGGPDGKGEGIDQSEENVSDSNQQGMGHPIMMTPYGIPPNFHQQFPGERPVYNGQQYPYPYGMYSGSGNVPMPFPYPFPFPGGKMPMDPRFMNRMAKPPTSAASQPTDRPATVKDSDLKALNDDTKENTSWAGAQEEVDYNAKLVFDESDESDEDLPSKSNEKKKADSSNATDKSDDKRKSDTQEPWPGYPQGFNAQMQMHYGQQNWARMAPMVFDPQRHPHPGGFPIQHMYIFPPYGFPPNMTPHAPVEKKDSKENDSDSKKDAAAQRKAEKQERLRDIGEQIKRREVGETLKTGDTKKKHDDGSQRRRNDSDASDSSRRSTTSSKDLPPRFQKQRSAGIEHAPKEDESIHDNQVKIMKRKESLLSDDDMKHIEKRDGEDVKTERKSSNASSTRSSQKGSQSSLDMTSERAKREAEVSADGNLPSKSKQSEKQEMKPYPKAALKDYSVSRESDKKKDASSARKSKDHSDGRSSSESNRFSDMKLTRNQNKTSKTKSPVAFDDASATVPSVDTKPSPWAKVNAPATTNDSKGGKSLKEIQQEEEEQERKKNEGKNTKLETSDAYRGAGTSNEERQGDFPVDQSSRNRRNDSANRYPNRNEKMARPERRGRFDNENRRANRFDGNDSRFRSDRRGRDYRYDDEEGRNSRKNYNETPGRYPQDDARKRKDDYRPDSRHDEGGYRKDKSEDRRRRDEYPSRGRSERGNERNDYYSNRNERYDKNSRYKERADDRSEKYSRNNTREQTRDSNRRGGGDKRVNEMDKKLESGKSLETSRSHDGAKESSVIEETNKEATESRKDTDTVTDPVQSKTDSKTSESMAVDSNKQDVQRGDDKRPSSRPYSRNYSDYADERGASRRGGENRRDDRREKRRDDRANDRRDDRKEDRTGDSRRDDRRSEGNRRDEKRRDDRRERYDSRKYNDRKESGRDSVRRNRDWDNRDYRQSEEYQNDVKHQKQRQGKEFEKSATEIDAESHTKKDQGEEKVFHEESKVHSNEKENKDKIPEKSLSNDSFVGAPRGGRKETFDNAPRGRNEVFDNAPRGRNEVFDNAPRGRRDGRGGRGGRRGPLSQDSRYDRSSTRRQQQSYSGHDKKTMDEKETEESRSELHSDSQDDNTEKMNEMRKAFAKSCERDTPPRFKKQEESRSTSKGRGRGGFYDRSSSIGERPRRDSSDRGRGSGRSRGRGRGGRGGFGSPSVDSVSNREEVSSDALISEVFEDRPSMVDDQRKNTAKRNQSRSYKNVDATGENKQNHFLAKRQQAGSKRATSSKSFDKSLPAADKDESSKSDEVAVARKQDASKENMKVVTDETSTHSPPKKMKPVTEKKEKKPDISQVYDLNNIRGIVIADHIATGADADVELNKENEDEGFTTVTSRRQQKEMREKQREEEKREQERRLHEQKREANKAQKALLKETKKNEQSSSKAKRMPFNDAPVSSVEVEQVTSRQPVVPSTTSVTAPASNAAMAAIGAWEPSQLLMRNQVTIAEQMKATPLASNVNAWQRPLSLTPITSLPDPRAVGTGKPSSSHTLTKSSLATPESASPIVTPTVPTPISSSMGKSVLGTPPIIDEETDHIKKSNGTSVPKTAHVVAEQKFDVSKDSMTEKPSKRVEKEKEGRRSSSNKENDHRPSRFSRRDNIDQKSSDEKKPTGKSGRNEGGRGTRKPERNERNERNDRTDRNERSDRSDRADRNKKEHRSKSYESRSSNPNNRSSSKPKNTRPAPPPNNESLPPSRESLQNDNDVFAKDSEHVIDDITQFSVPVSGNTPRKSILSDADKVVGSKKPSLKSQSSVGSYTSVGEIGSIVEPVEPVNVMVNVNEEFKSLPVEEKPLSNDDELSKHTARSVVKSLDDERSLETRSLPGTPPLAVKIPEPTLSGPSSDPGRAPSPNVSKSLSIAKEMSEMNIKLLNARKVWDDSPTISWSNAVVSSSNTTLPSNQAPDVSAKDVSDEMKTVSSVASEINSISKPIEGSSKPSEEKSIVGNFNTKRSEQQVCKVKPQQQVLPSDAASKTYDSANSIPARDRQVVSSKYASLVPNHDNRQHYQLQRSLYPTDPLSYNDNLRNQQSAAPAHQFPSFHSLSSQMRSVDNSVSPVSHQRDFLLSHPTASANIYGNSQIQSSQSLVALQVVSTPSVQPAKNQTPFQSANQTSLFAGGSAGLTNSALLFQYNSTFPPQRNASTVHNMGVLQVQQQQNTPSANTRYINQSLRRDQPYQGMPSTSESLMASTAQMGLLFDPVSNPGNLSSAQHSSQPPSNMMKHVHAKPFEPTSQTPPLMQSPPIIPQQSVAQMAGSSRPIVPTVFCQPGGGNASHVGRYSQPLLPHSPQASHRQAAIQPIPQQNPMVAQVRPRSVHGHTLNAGNSGSSLSLADTFSSYDANIALMASKNQIKTSGTHLSNQLNLHQMQLLNNPYGNAVAAAAVQPHLRNALAQVMNTGALNRPGPIQRPSQIHQSSNIQPKPFATSSASMNIGGPGGDFRKNQRQKMLEDTKKYFQQQGELNAANDAEKNQQSTNSMISSNTTKHPSSEPTSSKHEGYILSSSAVNDDVKKVEMKKAQRNGTAGDNYRNRNTAYATRRQQPGDSVASGNASSKSNKHLNEVKGV